MRYEARPDLSYADEICKAIILTPDFGVGHAIDDSLCLLLGLNANTVSFHWTVFGRCSAFFQ